MTQRRLSAEERAAVCRRYAAGEGAPALAAEYGVGRGVVYRCLAAEGVSRRYRALTPEQETAVVERYGAGESGFALAQEYGVANRAIYRILAAAGVARRAASKARSLSPDQRRAVRKRYDAGESSYALGAAYGVSGTAILDALEEEGAPRRTRRHAVREDAFDVPTPEAAYWTGFLLADGCVSDGGTVSLALAARDVEHVERFRAFLGAGSAVRLRGTTTPHPQAVLQVRSRPLAAALALRGVTPRKTWTAVAVGELADDPHFWRGVVDGDGSVGTWGRKRPQPGVFLCGVSLRLLEQFVGFAGHAIGGRTPTIYHYRNGRGGIHRAQVSGGPAVALVRMLYGAGGVALPRKQARADAILAARRGGA